MKRILILVTALILVSAGGGCAKHDSKAEFKKEAAEVCSVFDPEKRKDIPTNLQPSQIAQILSSRIYAAIHSDEMREIIGNVPKVNAKMRYQYVVDMITELTGEPFSCPAMDRYLNPTSILIEE